MVIIVILPILLTLFAALKTKTAINTTSPLAFPALHDMTFDNFKKVLTFGASCSIIISVAEGYSKFNRTSIERQRHVGA